MFIYRNPPVQIILYAAEQECSCTTSTWHPQNKRYWNSSMKKVYRHIVIKPSNIVTGSHMKSASFMIKYIWFDWHGVLLNIKQRVQCEADIEWFHRQVRGLSWSMTLALWLFADKRQALSRAISVSYERHASVTLASWTTQNATCNVCRDVWIAEVWTTMGLFDGWNRWLDVGRDGESVECLRFLMSGGLESSREYSQTAIYI